MDDTCHVPILCWPESFLLGLRDSGFGDGRQSPEPLHRDQKMQLWDPGLPVAICGCQQEAGGGSRLGLDQLPKWKKRPLCIQTTATQQPSGGGQQGQMASGLLAHA